MGKAKAIKTGLAHNFFVRSHEFSGLGLVPKSVGKAQKFVGKANTPKTGLAHEFPGLAHECRALPVLCNRELQKLASKARFPFRIPLRVPFKVSVKRLFKVSFRVAFRVLFRLGVPFRVSLYPHPS